MLRNMPDNRFAAPDNTGSIYYRFYVSGSFGINTCLPDIGNSRFAGHRETLPGKRSPVWVHTIFSWAVYSPIVKAGLLLIAFIAFPVQAIGDVGINAFLFTFLDIPVGMIIGIGG